MFTFKLLVLGESDAGKTCISKSYIGYTFDPNELKTRSLDLNVATVKINSSSVNVHFWEICNNFDEVFLKNADGIVLVFDLNNFSSFVKIKEYIEILNYKYPILLLGNKNDLQRSPRYKEIDFYKYCMENRIQHYFEVSAKNGNVNVAIDTFVLFLLETREIKPEKKCCVLL